MLSSLSKFSNLIYLKLSSIKIWVFFIFGKPKSYTICRSLPSFRFHFTFTFTVGHHTTAKSEGRTKSADRANRSEPVQRGKIHWVHEVYPGVKGERRGLQTRFCVSRGMLTHTGSTLVLKDRINGTKCVSERF